MSDHPMLAVHKLTVNELWGLFPGETDVRHELIDGVHFVTPTPITGISYWSAVCRSRSSCIFERIRGLGNCSAFLLT